MTYQAKKILFIGSVIFSKEILQHMLKKGFNIKAIITKKRKKVISDYFDLKKIKIKNKIILVILMILMTKNFSTHKKN